MPIRINLLAEDQAAEELRRQDPVKRALWIGGLIVALGLVWSSSLQMQIISEKGKLSELAVSLNSQTNGYQQVVASQKRLVDTEQKLGALQQLATNRFLWASVLNPLQQTAVNDVDLLQLKGEQTFVRTEEIKPRTNEFKVVLPGKPATVTEKTALILKARDLGPGPGDQIGRFKDAIANAPYFQSLLGKTNEVKLTSLSAPQVDLDSGKPCVLFTIECRFSEKVR
jgi:hypothetical protein